MNPSQSPRLPTLDDLSLADLEGVRLLLRGGSVIDWYRLNFEDADAIRSFLEVQGLVLDDPGDLARAEVVKKSAMSYLRRHFDFPIPKPVANEDLPGLIALASSKGHRQLCACTILKVMHIIHHLEARELLFRTAIREADLADRVHRRIMTEADRMHERGLPIVEFRGNMKRRSSLVTKLLAKKESVAAQIFDRVRYRIVTERTEQIPSVVLYLAEHLFPFSYAVPGQTQNNLVRFGDVLRAHPHGAEIGAKLQLPADLERRDPSEFRNEFSGKGFRVLNFVVDLPVRVDDLLPPLDPMVDELGRDVFSLVEFQVVDQATALKNEEGDASHERYKKRQLQRVLRRLSRGLVVPKRKAKPAKGAS